MIVTLSTFEKGSLKIPNAKATVNGADRTEEVQQFIDRYERELLIDGLGVALYEELKTAYPNIDTASQPLQDLVKGKSYELDGMQVNWEGLQGKDSLLAYYIYWNYIQESADLFSTFGVERPEGKGSKAVSVIPRAVGAYREFFKKYQGVYEAPKVIYSPTGVGVDYYGERSKQRSLLQYLQDNEADYPTAVFTLKENLNSFGL